MKGKFQWVLLVRDIFCYSVSIASVMVSSQVSSTPRNRVEFGGRRIRLTINLETVSLYNIIQWATNHFILAV